MQTCTNKKQHAFTLIEVVASLAIIAVMLTGILVAYHRTIDAVATQAMRRRAFAVAQRHMETLLAGIQEPNTINLPAQDEIDPDFTWQLDLQRITVDSSVPDKNLANTIIKATVTARCESDELTDTPTVELIRYFDTHGLKPISGHAVAVPITLEYEEPEWFMELKEKLGRDPSLTETIKHLIEIGDLPADVADELDIFQQDENLDPCDTEEEPEI